MYQNVHLRLNLSVYFKIELLFKLLMLMHLLVYKSAKINSMKGGLKDSLHVAFKGAHKTFFQGELKVAQKCEQKDTFDSLIDGLSLGNRIEGVLEGAPRDAINNL